jgi:hypothetical protein
MPELRRANARIDTHEQHANGKTHAIRERR